jgi:alpha-1,6-mannosyltransferase
MPDSSPLDAGERTVFPTTVPLDRRSLARATLPPPLRAGAEVAVLDISEFFGETSGGVRTYLLQKARHVAANPALRQVLVVPGARDLVLDGAGVRCYRLRGPTIPTRKPYRFMLAPRSAARIVAHERPDVLEVGSSWLGPWLVLRPARKARLPVVWFFHDHFPRIAGDVLEPRGGKMVGAAWRYVGAVARRCQAVLAPSEFVARDLESHGVERVVRVSLGVDLERLTPARRGAGPDLRRARGWDDAPLVLFAGRIAPEKRLDTLVAAWPDVARRTGARLLLVGDGPERARLGAAAHGSIEWLPFERDRERLADLFAAADLYVSPSPVETFGLAALEALASGTPVVTPDAGGVAELVARSGAGFVYPAREPAALAETIVTALGADRRLLGRRGRRYAEAHHAWPAVLARLFDVYRGVAAT